MAEPIAIVGLGCRFPGAEDPAAYWRLLLDGGEALRPMPGERWDVSEPARPLGIEGQKVGCLDAVDGFDWRALRLLPREARHMDPQHRLLLEVAWEALEDAGLPFEAVKGSRSGVFVGIQWNDFLRLLGRDWSKLDGYSLIGNGLMFAANRISHSFDLRGASVTLECGCASALVALQQACHSLWLGEADMAMVGAVELMLSPDATLMMSAAGLLSKNGACQPLDAAGDGFIRGEGAGVLVLKPLSKVSPRERVYAVIRSVSVVHNGRNEWIMAASAEAQKTAIRQACAAAGVAPSELDYVEMHATGNARGDAVELKALAETVGVAERRGAPCLVGSVKANFGHLGPASGIASLIKVALGLFHGRVPPMRRPGEVHPALKASGLGLELVERPLPWPRADRAPIAGVTALSLGGLSTHAILAAEGARGVGARAAAELTASPRAELLPLSARSHGALLALAGRYVELLGSSEPGRPSLRDLCFTAALGRSHHAWRLCATGRDHAELARSIEGRLEQLKSRGTRAQGGHGEARPLLVLVFEDGVATALEGQGEPLFARQVACAATLRRCGIVPGVIAASGRGRSAAAHVARELGLDVVEDAVAPDALWRAEGTEAMVLRIGPHSAWLDALAVLYERGFDIDWGGLELEGGQVVSLPVYPWQREKMWPEWLDARRVYTAPERSGEAPKEGTTDGGGAVARGTERGSMATRVRERIIHVLRLESSALLDEARPLTELGLDSIAASELQSVLELDFGIRVPASEILQAGSANTITEHLACRMNLRALTDVAGGFEGESEDVETFRI